MYKTSGCICLQNNPSCIVWGIVKLGSLAHFRCLSLRFFLTSTIFARTDCLPRLLVTYLLRSFVMFFFRRRIPSGTTCRCTAASSACRTRAPARARGGWLTRTPSRSCRENAPAPWTRRPSAAQRGRVSDRQAAASSTPGRPNSTPAATSCLTRTRQEHRHRR